MIQLLSGADYIAMRVMRELDRDEPTSDVAIDFEAAKSADREKDGTFTHPGQVLAKRALLALQKHGDTDWRTIFQLTWDWIAGKKVTQLLFTAAIAGVIVSWAGWHIILTPSDAGKVSIATLVPVLVGSLAFLAFPLLAQFGVETPFVLFRDLLLWLWRRLLQRRVIGLVARDMPTPQPRVLPILLMILDRPIGMVGVLCSHASWIAGYLTIVVGLSVHMGVHKYDFTWEATFATGVRQWLLERLLPAGADSENVIAYLSFGEGEPQLPQRIWERHTNDSQREVLREFSQLPLDDIRRAARLKQLNGISEVADVPTPGQQGLDDSRRSAFFKQLNELSDILDESLGHLNTIRQQIGDAKLSENTQSEAMRLHNELATLVEDLNVLLHAPAGSEADLLLQGASILTSANAIVNRVDILRGVIRDEVARKATNQFMELSRHNVALAILRLLFLVCIAPRVILGLIGRVQFFWARRSLQPNLLDDYHKTLIRRLQEQGTKRESLGNGPVPTGKPPTPVSDRGEIFTPDAEAEQAGLQPVAMHAEPEEKSRRSEVAPMRPPDAKRESEDTEEPKVEVERRELFVLSYEVVPPQEGWAAALQLGQINTVTDLGDAATRREDILKHVQNTSDSLAGVILVVNYGAAPGERLETFTHAILSPLTGHACEAIRFVLLTTGATRAMRKFRPPDLSRIEQLWHRFVQSIPLTSPLVQFDHEHVTADARARLRARWEKCWPALFADPAATQGGQPRYPEAFQVVLRWATKTERCDDPDEMRKLIDKMLEELDVLYRKEANDWWDSLIKTSQSCGEIMSRRFDSPEQLATVIEQVKSATCNVAQKSLFKVLSPFRNLPAWKRAALLGTGVLAAGGLTLPVTWPVIGFAATISPTFLAGVCTTLGVTVSTALVFLGVSRLLSRGPDAEVESAVVDALALDDLVRGGIVRVIILESQGRPPAEVAQQLESVLRDCDARAVNSLAQAHELCAHIERALTERRQPCASQ